VKVMDEMTTCITKTAPAKVNLCLHITGRRTDGYHQLESLFVRTKNGDQITVAPNEGLSLSLSGPFAADLSDAGVQSDNIILTAAGLLRSKAGIEQGALITLEKNLPIAAGIGGGSADAAATLLALNELWGLNWSKNRLEKIAVQLGADVPACLYNHPLWVTGVGEVVTSVDLDVPIYILLVNPMVGLSTPAVFKRYRMDVCEFDASLKNIPVSLSALQSTKNSLERSAVKLSGEITRVLSLMNTLADVKLVRMSGSGATCLALFQSSEARDKAALVLSKHHADWWVHPDIINVTKEP